MSGFQTVDGEKLKYLRQQKMLSQRDLAWAIGSTQATVSALEVGSRTAQPRTVRKLADALGVEPKDLLKEE
jgi:transcriptional regulator with XRE-family HTH domain